MALIREFESTIGFNRGDLRAVRALEGLKTVFKTMLEAGVVRDRPVDNQVSTPRILEIAASVPPPLFEKTLRSALNDLGSITALTGNGLFEFQEVRTKIPNIDQLAPLGRAQALQQLLFDAVEAIKANPNQIYGRETRSNELAYEVIYPSAVLGKTNEQVIDEIYVSRMTFYRRQKRGIQRMIEYLLTPSDSESSNPARSN